MDEGEMAMAIAHFLDNEDSWSATGLDIGEIEFTNEDGDKFCLTLERVEGF